MGFKKSNFPQALSSGLVDEGVTLQISGTGVDEPQTSGWCPALVGRATILKNHRKPDCALPHRRTTVTPHPKSNLTESFWCQEIWRTQTEAHSSPVESHPWPLQSFSAWSEAFIQKVILSWKDKLMASIQYFSKHEKSLPGKVARGWFRVSPSYSEHRESVDR